LHGARDALFRRDAPPSPLGTSPALRRVAWPRSGGCGNGRPALSLLMKGDSMRLWRVPTRLCLAGALGAALSASGPALAQTVALDRFDPAPAGDRMFGVESPYVAGMAVPHVSVLFDYAHNPFTLHHGPGQVDVGSVVGDQAFLHVDISLALFHRLLL